jgi:hypothetical protein
MARVYNYALTPAQVIKNYQAVLSKFTNNPYNLPANTSNTFTTSSNLLGYWDFTKTCSYTGGQTFVNDLSGSGRPLTIVSTVLPTYTSNGYTSITAGTNFGANVSATVAYSNLMTAECMFCTGSVSATVQPIIYNTAAATNGFNLRVNQTSSGGFTITGPNATTYYASSNVNVQSNTWYHMLAIVDKTRTLYIYINGTQVSSFPNISFIDPGTTPMGFGTTDAGTGYKLGLGRVYNVPLTPNQIWNNYVSSYNSGVYSNLAYTNYITNGLLGYWDFANYAPGSTTISDLSGNNKPLTLSAGVTYKNVNGAISGSMGTLGGANSLYNTSFTLSSSSGCAFEVLFYTSNTLAQQEFAAFTGGSGNILIGLSDNYGSNCLVWSNGSSSYANTAPGYITNNTWTHIVVTESAANSCQFYVNGVSVTVANNTNLNLINGTQTLSIGGRGTGGFSVSNVAMARVYSTPLTATQVQTNYYSAFNKLYGNPYALSPIPTATPFNYTYTIYPPVFSNFSTGAVTSTTAYFSGYSYGNGSYTASSSSTGTNGAGAAFIAGSFFTSAATTYSATTPGACTSGANLGTGNNGDWVKIQLPYPILTTNYTFTTTNNTATTNAPNSWRFVGSKDNVTWTTLHSYTGTYGANFNTYISVFSTSNQDYYQYYALVVTNVSAGTICSVGSLALYGYPQATQSLFNAPWPISLSSNVLPGPTPYITTNLVGYWDAAVSQSSPLSGLLLYDLSGNGSTMTFNSIPTYNSTGAISIGTSPTQNASTTMSTNFTSQYTVETLVKFNSLSGYQYLCGNYQIQPGFNGYNFFLNTGPSPSNNFSNTSVQNIQTGVWYHIVASMSASSNVVYINGQSIGSLSVVSTGLNNFGSVTSWYLNNYQGSGSSFDASYGFWRLYNSNLSASQVQTNYLNALTRLAGNPYNLPIPTTGLASGGNITLIPNSNTYVHQFTTSGILTVTATITANVLIVGGGGGGAGGGGNSQPGGGGGGAGGLIYLTNQVIYPGTYSVVVGAGGVGAGGNAQGTSGSNSWIQGLTSIVAIGGGAGGGNLGAFTALPGGSGGGGIANGGLGTAGQGNNGAAGSGLNAGGGGGAGGVGTAGGGTGGNGGNGLAYNITGTTSWYCGGGAGGTNSVAVYGIPGIGSGPNSYGGGGTGGANVQAGGTSEAGGPGTVIISYTDGLTSNVGYSFDNLAAVNSTQGSATGLYSLKRLTRKYTGPVVQLLASTLAGPPVDFFSDSIGNLTANVTNQPIYSWISVNSPNGIPFANIWYDQSGLGNHATNTSGLIPQFDYINNRLDFTAGTGTSFYNLPNGTIPYGDQSFTASFKFGTSNINSTTVYSSGPFAQNNQNSLYFNNSNYYYSSFGNSDQYSGPVTSYATCSVRYGQGQAGQRLVNVNGVNTSLTSGGTIATRNSIVTPCYIGQDVRTGVYKTLGTQLYYIDFFNSNVQTNDLQFIENQYVNQDLYYSNVMILLHCQGYNNQALTSNIIDNAPYNTQPTYAITGAPTCSTTTPKFGYSSWNFPVSTGVIVTPAVSTQYTFGSNNFTICFWVYPSSVSIVQYFLGNTTNTSTLAANQWRVSMSATGFPQFEYYTTSPQTITSSVAITASTWHHLGVTRNGTTLTLWVNGVSRATGTLSGSLDTVTTNTLNIATTLTGNFQELRITRDTVRYVSTPFPLQISPSGPQEYPPLASGAITTAQYGNGTYTTTASTGTAANAFDKTATAWAGASTYVSGTPYATSTPATTTNTSTIILGDWIQLQTPVLVTLLQYSIHPISSSIYPSAWTLLASKDGIAWTTIDTRTAQTYSATMVYSIATTNSNSFYFRLIVTTVIGATTAQIGEIKYYGY